MIVNRSEIVIGRIVLVVVLVLTVIPLVNMLSAALQPADVNPTGLSFPTDPQWINFVTAFEKGNVWRLMGSSLFIVVFVVPISLVCATLAGYALGNLRIAGGRFLFIFLILGLTIPFEALEPSTVMLLGGEPVGERFLDWNFVSSSKDRLEQAKADWRAGRMKLPDLDNGEFIPLPQTPPPASPTPMS